MCGEYWFDLLPVSLPPWWVLVFGCGSVTLWLMGLVVPTLYYSDPSSKSVTKICNF